jgi:hypothetical protein
MAATRRNFLRNDVKSSQFGGAVAQLGERLVRNEEVRGSNPLGSTKPKDPILLSFPASEQTCGESCRCFRVWPLTEIRKAANRSKKKRP